MAYSALHLVEPDAGAREPIGRPDVEHEEAVEVADGGSLVDVVHEEIGVTWIGASVAADVNVPAPLGGNESNVFALSLRAFADASADAALDLVRRPNPLVTVLDEHGERRRVLDAESAPRRADAALHRSERLAVRVAALQAGV